MDNKAFYNLDNTMIQVLLQYLTLDLLVEYLAAEVGTLLVAEVELSVEEVYRCLAVVEEFLVEEVE